MSVWLAIVVVYGLALLGLSLYSLNHAALSVVFWRHRRRLRPAGTLPAGTVPWVTLQLPMYNEFYVAERVIRSACDVDYPADRLEIQVLDDSTDETLELTRRLVAEYQARGVSIVHLHRQDRKGFKGGALAHGFARARGEFVAVFDADFVVPRDFLRRTLPHFADPSTGIVQTRWAYFNETFSELTRAMALALDGHFVVEQSARCWAGWFMNFNGTAGVLRAQAIVDAGGWQDDTITEDLDLSYRAQLAGWGAKYVPEIACDSEIPTDIHSLKTQQFRWTKGAQETARKILPALWRSQYPLAVKCQGTVHLLSSLAYPLIITIAILNPFVMVASTSHQLGVVWPVWSLNLVAFAGTLCCYYTAALELGGAWWSRIARFPLFLALSVGMSVHNTRAALEGMLGKRSAFERTPKYRVTGDTGASPLERGDSRTKSTPGSGRARYKSQASWSVIGEFALAFMSLIAAVMAAWVGNFGALPFLVVFTVGYTLVGAYSIAHMRYASRQIRLVPGLRAVGHATAHLGVGVGVGVGAGAAGIEAVAGGAGSPATAASSVVSAA